MDPVHAFQLALLTAMPPSQKVTAALAEMNEDERVLDVLRVLYVESRVLSIPLDIHDAHPILGRPDRIEFEGERRRAVYRLPLWPDFECTVDSNDWGSSIRFSRPRGQHVPEFRPEDSAWRFVEDDLRAIGERVTPDDRWGYMHVYLVTCVDREYVMRFDVGVLQEVSPRGLRNSHDSDRVPPRAPRGKTPVNPMHAFQLALLAAMPPSAKVADALAELNEDEHMLEVLRAVHVDWRVLSIPIRPVTDEHPILGKPERIEIVEEPRRRAFFRLPLWPAFEFRLDSSEWHANGLRFERRSGHAAPAFDPDTAPWRFVEGDLEALCSRIILDERWGYRSVYRCTVRGSDREYVLRFDLGLLQRVTEVKREHTG